MRVVFVAGIMDMLHKGHLNLLREMRKAGDRVVVILHDDYSCFQIKEKFPVQDLEHRIRNLEMTKLADSIIPCPEKDPANLFEYVIETYGKENVVYMRGDDLTENFPGQWMLKKYDIPIKFIPYTKGISSTKLRDSL